MPRRLLAFDIETAKQIPNREFNWREHRPLGITCAALYPTDAEPLLFFSTTRSGAYRKQMTAEDCCRLACTLEDYADDGYTLATWNGLAFDFDVLAEESRLPDLCKRLALEHVDGMFHAFCLLGYPIGLQRVASALGIRGKPDGLDCTQAPQLWAEGRQDQVLDYVANDARLTADILRAAEQLGQLSWITRKNDRRTIKLPQGLLTVKQACRLPEPDNSWMTNPLTRQSFLAWLGS